MPKKNSIAIFIAATSALAISTTTTNSAKSGENDLGGLKEWNTDMALDADFKLDKVIFLIIIIFRVIFFLLYKMILTLIAHNSQ